MSDNEEKSQASSQCSTGQPPIVPHSQIMTEGAFPQDTEDTLDEKAWHLAEAHRPLRGVMVADVARLLAGKFPTKSESSIRRISEQFERYIYHKANSLNDYQSRETLQRRLFAYALSKRQGSAPCPCCGGAALGSETGSINCAAGVACCGAKRDQNEQRREQQQLILQTRHASRCCASPGSCASETCAALKERWTHLNSCRDRECSVPNCVTTRNVINHYTLCKDQDCVLCGPVREVVRRSLSMQQERVAAEPLVQTGNRMSVRHVSRKQHIGLCHRITNHLLPACAKDSTGENRKRPAMETVCDDPHKRSCTSSLTELPPNPTFFDVMRAMSHRAAMKGFVFGQPLSSFTTDESDPEEDDE